MLTPRQSPEKKCDLFCPWLYSYCPSFNPLLRNSQPEASGPVPQTTPTPSITCKMLTALGDGKETGFKKI